MLLISERVSMVDPIIFPEWRTMVLPIGFQSQQTRPRTKSKKFAQHIGQYFKDLCRTRWHYLIVCGNDFGGEDLNLQPQDPKLPLS
jgi:hypothetical protein